MKIIFEAIYFIFPLLFAGLIHHLLIIRYNLFSFFAKPIDFNWSFNNKLLFGKSKTWRGMLFVPLLSGFGSLVISQIIILPMALNPFVTGFLLGIGYSVAELPNSFLKRRLNIASGEKAENKFRFLFAVLDQTDSVIGAILMLLIIYPASLLLCVLVLVIGVFFHFIVDLYLNKYGYKKLRKY